jgi:hypothetical protein
VSLAAWYLVLSVPFGPGLPGPILLEAGAVVRVEAPILTWTAWRMSGLATPFGYLADPRASARWTELEELLHVAQWEALGPALPLAYLLTAGEPFEPYGRGDAARMLPGGRVWRPSHDLARMWAPDARRFPQWRVTIRDGVRVEFMPGWRLP